MKNKTTILFIFAVLLASLSIISVVNKLGSKKENLKTGSVTIKNVESKILANGKIASQNEATLHFQTGGKLTNLTAKEGDTVYQGQTIANLDTYALQRQMTAALNNYRSTRDSFDQTKQNTTNGVAVGQQRYSLEVANKANLSGQNEVDIIGDMIKRLVDQNQANLDNSVISVELANYALQLSSLTAPFNGVVVHEDVNQAGVNITPATAFMVIDPSAFVFRTQVNEQDVDYINTGSEVSISLNGDSKKYAGSVLKIYPEKITLSTGGNVYNVDIASPDFKNVHYAQAGSVQIKSNTSGETKLVPVWTVLNGQQVWVDEGSQIQLKNIRVGKKHGDYIEVLSGLNENDKIIINPKSVIQNKYNLL